MKKRNLFMSLASILITGLMVVGCGQTAKETSIETQINTSQKKNNIFTIKTFEKKEISYSTSAIINNGDPINKTEDNNQSGPSIAAMTDGGFVVNWMGNQLRDSGNDGNLGDVYYQRYDANITPMFQEDVRVNEITYEKQRNPVIAVRPDGKYVIAWDSYYSSPPLGTNDRYYTKVKIYNSDNSVYASELPSWIPEYDECYERPQICTLSDNKTIVVKDYCQLPSSVRKNESIRYDVINASGGVDWIDKLVVETTDSSTALQDKYALPKTVCELPNGKFIVIWNTGSQIWGKIYNSDFSVSRDKFKLYDDNRSSQKHLSIVSMTNGEFIVCWASNYADNENTFSLNYQRYNSNGDSISDVKNIIQYEKEYIVALTRPAITKCNNGTYAITWSTNFSSQDDYGIYAQKIKPDNEKDGDIITISDLIGSQSSPDIAGLEDGRYIVVWQENDSNSSGVYGYEIEATLLPPTAKFILWNGNISTGGAGGAYRHHLADINGDGRDDLIQFDTRYAIGWYSLATTDGTFNLWNGTIGTGGCGGAYRQHFADINGDGRDDLIQFDTRNGNSWYSLATPQGTFSLWNGSIGTGEYGGAYRHHFADVNGDGRDDLIQFDNRNSNGWVALATPQGTFNLWNHTISTGGMSGAYYQHFADINGDGRDDLIQFDNRYSNGWISYATSQGTFNLWNDTIATGGAGGAYRHHFADVNGDGRDDLIQFDTRNTNGWYSYATTDGLFNLWDDTIATGEASGAYSQHLGDINGDGKADLVQFDNRYTHGWISYSN